MRRARGGHKKGMRRAFSMTGWKAVLGKLRAINWVQAFLAVLIYLQAPPFIGQRPIMVHSLASEC